MNLTLRTHGVPGATIGVLTFDGSTETFCSIELPWDNNQPNKSCVPAGIFELIRFISEEHGLTWKLHNPALNIYGEGIVPDGGRDAVELHSANFARQLLGCIALGLSGLPMLDPVTHQVEPAVQDSGAAITRLRALLGSQPGPHALTIVREDGEGT
jgi:hypothetical protein